MTPKRKEPDLSTYSGRVAARLRMLRDRAGLSVEEVAAQLTELSKTEIDRFRIYKWESGIASPPYDFLPYLARIFGVSVRGLLPPK